MTQTQLRPVARFVCWQHEWRAFAAMHYCGDLSLARVTNVLQSHFWFLKGDNRRWASPGRRTQPLHPGRCVSGGSDFRQARSVLRYFDQLTAQTIWRPIQQILKVGRREAGVTGSNSGHGDVGGPQPRLTAAQEEFLRLVVSVYQSGQQDAFMFTRSNSGSGLIYPGSGLRFRPSLDEFGLRSLHRAGLIEIEQTEGVRTYVGMPTDAGIAAIAKLSDERPVNQELTSHPSKPEEPSNNDQSVDAGAVGAAAGLPRSMGSREAAELVRQYMETRGLDHDRFGRQAKTTGRTIHSFLRTGKVRRDIFNAIAKALGLSPHDLLRGVKPSVDSSSPVKSRE